MNKNIATYGYLPVTIIAALDKLAIIKREDLLQLGSIKAFLLLKSLGLSITQSILWKLYAIEQDLPLAKIDAAKKAELSLLVKNHYPIADFPPPSVLNHYMSLALLEAKKAYHAQEVPIGAIIVYNEQVIARAFNQCIAGNFVANHAEILALKRASEYLKNYRLTECDLYVTVEPCVMCVGAIIQARVKRLIYAAQEPKMGAVESVIAILKNTQLNKHTAFMGGVLASESNQLLIDFFLNKRAHLKK